MINAWIDIEHIPDQSLMPPARHIQCSSRPSSNSTSQSFWYCLLCSSFSGCFSSENIKMIYLFGNRRDLYIVLRYLVYKSRAVIIATWKRQLNKYSFLLKSCPPEYKSLRDWHMYTRGYNTVKLTLRECSLRMNTLFKPRCFSNRRLLAFMMINWNSFILHRRYPLLSI